jgi:hypothetical protein
MADVRLPVRGGRAVIEGIGRPSFALFDTLLEYLVFLPKLERFFFAGYKIQRSVHLVIH